MKIHVIIKKKSACGPDIDEGLFDVFKRKKKDAESDFLYSGPIASEMPREAKNNPDIVRKALEILEDEPEGMSYTDLMAVLEKNTNASIHEDIPETLKNLPDFFRDEERNFIIPDEMRKRHKRWRSLNMENIFESFRRYMAENDEDDWEDEEDALPEELESFRRIVTQEYWQEKRPHLEIPSDQMFDMALKLEKIKPDQAYAIIDPSFESDKMKEEMLKMIGDIMIYKIKPAQLQYQDSREKEEELERTRPPRSRRGQSRSEWKEENADWVKEKTAFMKKNDQALNKWSALKERWRNFRKFRDSLILKKRGQKG